jgi:hydroxymethylbilane synthase
MPQQSTTSNAIGSGSAGGRAGVARIGTRGSTLALAQTELIISALRARHPEVFAERIVVRTDGDVDKTSPLTAIGGRGVFTSALQDALRRGTIDAAVHSAKDLPSEEPPGLALSAFLLRDDPRDVVVSRHARPLLDLPPNPTIGTSSRRRAIQVRALRPDARIVDLRGNVDTRLRKAFETELDGIVLAAAGVLRMGYADRIAEFLPVERFVPSPGQGALAVETHDSPTGIAALVSELDDPVVSVAIRTERAFLRGVGGGCTTPIGAYARNETGAILFRCMLASEDGERVAWANERLDPADAERDAEELARQLLAEIGRAPLERGIRASAAVERPLAGLSVLVTRPTDQAAKAAEALRAAGAEPILAPMIRIEDPTEAGALDATLRRVAEGGFDWVVFTSGNAVEHVLSRLRTLGLDSRVFSGVKVAAVGIATAAKLEDAGVPVAVVPSRFDAESVLAALTDRGVDDQRILLPQGNLARDTLATGFAAAGAQVEVVQAYRTVAADRIDSELRTRLFAGGIDVLTFASPSSVRTFAAFFEDVAPLRRSAIACVGPVTAEAAREAGLRVDIVAAEATVAGLISTLIANRDRVDAIRRFGPTGVAPAALDGSGARATADEPHEERSLCR